MSKHEIQYCLQALGSDTGVMAKDRMFLFSILLEMPEYDKEKINKAIKDRRIANNLAVEKNRLFQQLTDHLSLFLESRKSANNPAKFLQQAEALVHLDMLDEALEVTQKGITWAVRLEELHFEVKLRDLLRLIYKNMGQQGLDVVRTENEYLMETAAKKLARSVRYRLISDRAYDYLRRYRVTDLESIGRGMEELINLPEMKDINKADSLHAQLHFYEVLNFYHSSRNELSEAIEAQTRYLKLQESSKDRMQLHPYQYLNTISNILGKLSMLGRYEEAPELLAKMEDVVVRGKREEANKFSDVELQYQLYYMNSGQLEKVFDREIEVQNGLRRFGKGIRVSTRLTVLYNFGVAHLLCDNSGRALSYFNQIRELGVLPHREDLQGVARLIRLLLLAEDDSAGTFTHYLRNSKRFFRSEHRVYELEMVIITWLDDHHRITGKEQRSVSFQALATSLQRFVKGGMVGAEEVQIWAVAHAKQMPASEVFKQGLHKIG